MTDEPTEISSAPNEWSPVDGGATLGQEGSEGGVIVRDDEHPLGARATLERGGFAPWSITCGLYGWMVHTIFFRERAEAEAAMEVVEAELAAILEAIPAADDDAPERIDAVVAMIGAFVDRHR
ncbi:MAG TPA: hypothetical protein VFQ39_12255 [Longimicrobium sp.]|nr:hypothetical protein [Longimicrobium sp.]